MDFEHSIDTAGSPELISYNTWGGEEEVHVCITLGAFQDKLCDTKATKPTIWYSSWSCPPQRAESRLYHKALCITQIAQVFHWFDLPHERKLTVKKELLRITCISLRDCETPLLGGEEQVRNLLPLLSAWNCWSDSWDYKLLTAAHERVSTAKEKRWGKGKLN